MNRGRTGGEISIGNLGDDDQSYTDTLGKSDVNKSKDTWTYASPNGADVDQLEKPTNRSNTARPSRREGMPPRSPGSPARTPAIAKNDGAQSSRSSAPSSRRSNTQPTAKYLRRIPLPMQ